MAPAEREEGGGGEAALRDGALAPGPAAQGPGGCPRCCASCSHGGRAPPAACALSPLTTKPPAPTVDGGHAGVSRADEAEHARRERPRREYPPRQVGHCRGGAAEGERARQGGRVEPAAAVAAAAAAVSTSPRQPRSTHLPLAAYCKGWSGSGAAPRSPGRLQVGRAGEGSRRGATAARRRRGRRRQGLPWRAPSPPDPCCTACRSASPEKSRSSATKTSHLLRAVTEGMFGRPGGWGCHASMHPCCREAAGGLGAAGEGGPSFEVRGVHAGGAAGRLV